MSIVIDLSMIIGQIARGAINLVIAGITIVSTVQAALCDKFWISTGQTSIVALIITSE